VYILMAGVLPVGNDDVNMVHSSADTIQRGPFNVEPKKTPGNSARRFFANQKWVSERWTRSFRTIDSVGKMLKVASVAYKAQTFEDEDILDGVEVTIVEEDVIHRCKMNPLWFSIALIPSAIFVGLYVSQTALYSQTQWTTLQMVPEAYCEIFSPLTYFIATLMVLFLTRKLLQHFVMHRAYKPFKSLSETSQRKSTREVTEIIARGWTLALCIPSLTMLSLENGLEAPYFLCKKTNISELVKLQCLSLSRLILCAQIVCDLYSGELNLSWDMILHHAAVCLQLILATDAQMGRIVFESYDSFRYFDAISIFYGVAAGGVVKYTFNLCFRLCSAHDYQKQVFWIQLSYRYHLFHTFVFFIFVIGYFTFHYITRAHDKMGTFEMVFIVFGWFMLSILELWIGYIYKSILKYKRQKMNAADRK